MNRKGEIHLAGLNESSYRLDGPSEDGNESREEKVARLKKAVAEGSYYVPALEIADRMLAAASW